MTTKTSRRAILAGAAVLPALAIPAAAFSSPAVDPIFAAIEKHRKIEAAFAASGKETGDCSDELCDKSNDAYVALVKMTPTTLVGCAALLRHLETNERSYGADALLSNHRRARIAARDLLTRIAAMLASKAVQS